MNGRTVDAAVVQIKGRSYIDVENLPEYTGPVAIEANRTVLTIPVSNASAS